MKILFVARAIDGMAGGVERIVTTVMNALADRGHLVRLLTWDCAEADSFYPIAPEVAWKRLNLGDPAVKAGQLLRLRRALTVRKWILQFKPDIIVCFQDGPFMALRTYTVGMGIPVIAAERNAPTRFEHLSGSHRRIITYNALRFAKRIIIQFENYKKLYPDFLKDRIITIPNPVSPTKKCGKPGLPGKDGRFRILSVGRLSYQKNFAVLLKAFSRIAPAFPGWDLVILGEGESRGALEELIELEAISDRVSMPGTTASISDWYASSHLFCLTSRWEGFPNALAEAMAHGLPSIGFAGCAGVQDLIKSGENGLLADGNGDFVSFSMALARAMSSAELRDTMGAKAKQSVSKYAPERIFSLWEEALRKAAIA